MTMSRVQFLLFLIRLSSNEYKLLLCKLGLVVEAVLIMRRNVEALNRMSSKIVVANEDLCNQIAYV